VKISFVDPRGDEWGNHLRANIAHSSSLGIPYVGLPLGRHPQRLAVVGGGPSTLEIKDELRAWDGQVWAINGAWGWCRDNGIDAAFFSVDPNPIVADLCRGAKRAFLGSVCDPSAFAALAGTCMIVKTFPDNRPHTILAGSTTATMAPEVGVRCGFTDITFFGCESSYPRDQTRTLHDDGTVTLQTHAYMRERVTSIMIVRAAGEDFVTEPEYLIQAETLADAFKAAPHILKDRSGGLLSAMIKDPDYDLLAVSPEIAADICPKT
jgi:hypothetical protein